MAITECFRCLSRISHDKDRVGVWQIHCKEVDLALDATNDTKRFTKVDLSVAGRMLQWHEHLTRFRSRRFGNVVLHDRNTAREAVLVAKSLEYPLGCMALLLGKIPVGD